MERSESSDSDSNSSTSWVFVSDNSSPIEHTTNTFHLDCSQEPIQELTEQDFVSAGSDIETESDGVSIISETDASNEEYENKTGESTSESKHVCDTLYGDISIFKKVDTSLLSQVKRFLRGSNIVGVGVVLTAVFLGSYSFKKITVKDTADFISNNEFDKKDYTNFLCENSANLEEIVDITIACTYGSSESKVLTKSEEIKQCVMDKYETQVFTSPNSDKNKYNEVHSHLNSIEKSTEKTYNLYKFEAKRNKRMGNDLVNNVMSKQYKNKGSEKKHDSSKPSLITKSKGKPYKPKPPKIVKQFDSEKRFPSKKNRTSNEHKMESGEWYINLHKARQRLRKQASDHDIHITKGTKNKWYFKWMNGREQLRRKSIYKPYSRYLNI